jgi:hypothetical protein
MYYDIINTKWHVLRCFILFGYPLFGQPHGMYCDVFIGLAYQRQGYCVQIHYRV